jgi:CO dehydrogenase maturation factor
LVVNRVGGELCACPQEKIEIFDAGNTFILPDDPLLAQFDREGKPTITLPDNVPVVEAAETIFAYLFAGQGANVHQGNTDSSRA